MTDLEELTILSDTHINEVARALCLELKEGRTMIKADKLSEVLGCSSDMIRNAIREQKVGFGMCHRSENAKSWTTSAYIPLVGKWLSQYDIRKNNIQE